MFNPVKAALTAREALPLVERTGALLLAESGLLSAAAKAADRLFPSVGKQLFRPKSPFHFDTTALPGNRNSTDFQLQVSKQLGLDPQKFDIGKVAVLHRRITQQPLDRLTRSTSRDLGMWGSQEQGMGLVEYQTLPSSRGYLKPSESVVRVTKTLDAEAPVSHADRAGSGVFVTRDGKIATNEHVVRNSSKLSVETLDGKIYAARVVSLDTSNDLAILQLSDFPNGTKFSVPTFADRETFMQGSRVAAIGHHGGLKGLIASPGQFNCASTWGKNRYTIDSVMPGASGSPIFDNRGQLVGLVAKISPITPGQVTGPSTDLIRRVLMQIGVRA
ncbi:MAG: hypothetical protein C0473_01030 [Cyanobacteria bacterium DS3.002]|nr:hypothetical protein [Cyanobacteria bacterium DS3.002]